MRPFDIVTFDCYGTLIDWEAGITKAFQDAAAADGVSLDPAAGLRALFDTRPASEAPARSALPRGTRHRTWAARWRGRRRASAPRSPCDPEPSCAASRLAVKKRAEGCGCGAGGTGGCQGQRRERD
jgi:phosphoglycolate phosphatase-like HAD superfamily hydrolase